MRTVNGRVHLFLGSEELSHVLRLVEDETKNIENDLMYKEVGFVHEDDMTRKILKRRIERNKNILEQITAVLDELW